MEKIIEISNLKKSYKDIQAVKGINFYVEKGSLFAFLGPNGAGKSTTIDILSTFLQPDEGEILVNGHRLGKEDDAIRSDIGIVFQDNLLDRLLTVKENLMLRGSLYPISKSEKKLAFETAVNRTGIAELLDRPYGKLSGGQRRRVDIARALLHTPKILILDEPTTGLDPQTRSNIWDTIKLIQKENGMTVFLTTHYMEEAAKADYVVVIDKGEIISKGTPAMLKEEHSTDYMIINPKDMDKVLECINSMNLKYEKAVDTITIAINSTLDALPILEKCQDDLIGFQVIKGTMDDVFINLTGKEIRE